jgi:hypothetical protein
MVAGDLYHRYDTAVLQIHFDDFGAGMVLGIN